MQIIFSGRGTGGSNCTLFGSIASPVAIAAVARRKPSDPDAKNAAMSLGKLASASARSTYDPSAFTAAARAPESIHMKPIA